MLHRLLFITLLLPLFASGWQKGNTVGNSPGTDSTFILDAFNRPTST